MENKENRKCRKCGEIIPYSLWIDGKKKNLQNRKFCLKCSSYGGHNVFPDDPSRKSKEKCYTYWTETDKVKNRFSMYKRGLKRKEELIEMSGGKCSVCGYSKCIDALVFHHKDETTKLFGLALNMLWSKNWTLILEEFKKCILLCSNCHIELHRKLSDDDPLNCRTLIKSNMSNQEIAEKVTA